MKNLLRKPVNFDFSLKFLVIIVVYIAYNTLIFHSDLILMSEGTSTPKEKIPLYFTIIVLPYLIFLYTFFKNFFRLKFIRFIIFPISFCLIIYFGFFSVACITSGGIVLLILFIIIPAFIFLVLSSIVGLIYDIKDWKNFFKDETN